MKLNLFLLLISAALVAAPCLVLLTFSPDERRASGTLPPLKALGLGAALQFLASLPAGLLQAFVLIPQLSGRPAWAKLAVPLLAAPINMAGVTVRTVVAAVAAVFPGLHSQAARAGTALDFLMLPLLLGLMFLQVGVLASAFVRLNRPMPAQAAPRRSLLLYSFMALLLMNSLFAAARPWWPAQGASLFAFRAPAAGAGAR